VTLKDGSNNVAASFDVSFKVKKATLTVEHLQFDPTDTTYSGTPQGIADLTLNPDYSGMGEITVYYTGTGDTHYAKSTNAPTDAGTYAVSVDITEGANYAAVTDLVLYEFTIKKVEPTAEDLDFDLGDIVYRGRPEGIDTPTIASSYTGLGVITVKYNGVARLPDEPGTYIVTVDIAAGANFAGVTGLVLGTFVILEPTHPGPITRYVTLPTIPGATTDPPAGIHTAQSGSDFTFTLRLSAAFSGFEPQVTTGRETDADGDGVICRPNADDSYTIRIRTIRQNLELVVTLVPSHASGTVDAARSGIWAAGNRLFLAAVRSGQARIYTLAGTLVKTVTVVAGETVEETLPTGFYIVALDGERRKIVVSD
jgi:hypothetical protein